MATKASKNSRTSRTRTKQKGSGASPAKVKSPKKSTEAESAPSGRFVKDLLVRGEAAEPDQEGKLPLNATHGIVKKNKDGTVTVKRARFKYF